MSAFEAVAVLPALVCLLIFVAVGIWCCFQRGDEPTNWRH